MTEMWMRDADYGEFDDSAEYDDSDAGEFDPGYESDLDDFDAERVSSRTARQRQVAAARARRVALRAQAQAARRSARRPAARPPTTAASAIRRLDLETKVADDSFRRAVVAQGKRMSRAEYAAVTGAAVNQFIESFQTPDNPYVKAALRFSPLLLLSPQRKGTGAEALIKDPRVIGAAAVAGITVIGENRNKFARASRIEVSAPDELPQDGQDTLIGDVLDRSGQIVSGKAVKWTSSDSSIVSVDEATGKVVAKKKPGTVVITAEADGIVRRVRVTVV